MAETNAAPLPYEAHADLIIGRRAEQQDCLALHALPSGKGAGDLLIVVADGMGGHVGGAVASALAVNAFIATFDASDSLPVGQRLDRALDAANAAIGTEIAARPELRGMGCTLVAAVQTGRNLYWISVGDTLLLEIRNGQVERLNADHSLAPLLDAQAQRGEITLEEARKSEQRHMLRSALTGGRVALTDQGETVLSGASLLVAATDGLHTLDDPKIGELAAVSASPAQFIAAALAAIGQDMPADQDNTALAATRVPGSVTRRLDGPSDQPLGSARKRRLAGFALLLLGVLVGSMALLLSGWLDSDPQPSSSQPVAAKSDTPEHGPATNHGHYVHGQASSIKGDLKPIPAAPIKTQPNPGKSNATKASPPPAKVAPAPAKADSAPAKPSEAATKTTPIESAKELPAN